MLGLTPLKRRIATLEREIDRLKRALEIATPGVRQRVVDQYDMVAYAQAVKDCHEPASN
jgi:hypothetical protein